MAGFIKFPLPSLIKLNLGYRISLMGVGIHPCMEQQKKH